MTNDSRLCVTNTKFAKNANISKVILIDTAWLIFYRTYETKLLTNI